MLEVRVVENQGDLNCFKKEILSESENLTPLLTKSIDKGIWPMLKFNKEIRTLVKKRQKYLAMLSNQYGFRSATVIRQVDEWLTKLDLRVFAIESVYRSPGGKWHRACLAGIECKIIKGKRSIDKVYMTLFNKYGSHSRYPE